MNNSTKAILNNPKTTTVSLVGFVGLVVKVWSQIQSGEAPDPGDIGLIFTALAGWLGPLLARDGDK